MDIVEILKLKRLAEAELGRLRSQEPVAYMDSRYGLCWYKDRKPSPETMLYAEPKPPTHPGATHCENCGCTWLDDGLNPLGCPYCNFEVIPTGSHLSPVAARKICGNCESAMPKGCGGVFKSEGSACWLNTDAATLPDCKGE